mmetsp:Transcript_4780/g.12079  ORF Transcript_4780/g.12079 Transcript_4780/m.12079 type:complete len:82 (-) Transcript_4780:215-460(-)|eukprot:CAMPEP_0113252976 /NCGR_PEP_ID=MMETSP0008_2-20120614/12924_1 /TAXON_ID=97485 /ORGANISM="Prymnesium parvum" /LENGTH=81 /DNA_ID=CAMNT_0000101101 /DNA_START=270 /DNA_END=515 /DNA_ORIENTATION=+ /assembly_acc=CAM_ASM_000153
MNKWWISTYEDSSPLAITVHESRNSESVLRFNLPKLNVTTLFIQVVLVAGERPLFLLLGLKEDEQADQENTHGYSDDDSNN